LGICELSSQILIVLEFIVQQRHAIQKLQDECAAFRTQIKELPLHPNFGSPPKSANEFSEATSSPTKAPPLLDLNSSTPDSNRGFLGRKGLTIST
jgi:hypothetical protein